MAEEVKKPAAQPPDDWVEFFDRTYARADRVAGLERTAARSRSWWSLDSRSSLALAIVVLMMSSILMLVVLSMLNVKVDPTIFAVLTTLLGVLAGSFKDVYGFFYGSSSGSKDKDDALTKMAVASSGTGPGTVTVQPPVTAP